MLLYLGSHSFQTVHGLHLVMPHLILLLFLALKHHLLHFTASEIIVMQSMGSQKARHDRVTSLHFTSVFKLHLSGSDLKCYLPLFYSDTPICLLEIPMWMFYCPS